MSSSLGRIVASVRKVVGPLVRNLAVVLVVVLVQMC